MLQRLLDHAVSIATVVLAICAVFVIVTRDERPASHALPSPLPAYQPGDSIASVSGLDLAPGRRTLLVVLRSDCAFCTSSVAFHRQIMERRDQKRNTFTVIAVGPENDAGLDAYLTENKFAPDQVVRIAPGSLKVRGTPTLVLVGESGVVERIWEGALSKGGEKAVLDALFATDAS